MSSIIVTQVWTYPVKSLRGLRTPRGSVSARGLAWDRHWLVVDEDGGFLSQRSHPRMALVRTMLTQQNLTLQAPGMIDLVVTMRGEPRGFFEVKVWSYSGPARPVGAQADAWLSSFLKTSCRLVEMPSRVHRTVGRPSTASQPRGELAFADAYPFLLISEGSLEDLNDRLEQPVTMERFRPNLVVRGCGAYAEDGWSRARIGAITLHMVKPCPRCGIPNVNPETARRTAEPIATLASYRRAGQEIYFGMNAVHEGGGIIEEGMKVLVE